jgi:hypothetical protein
MRTQASTNIMVTRDKIVGWLFGATLLILASLIVVAYATSAG